MNRSVIIDCFPEHAKRYGNEYAIVAVDVFRTTTTLITAALAGWQCHVAPTLDAAVELSRRLPDCVLAGELGGSVPYGFELDNSPTAVRVRLLHQRRLVLLSTSGTPLICVPPPEQAVYVASLQNWSAQSAHLQQTHPRVALIGAGARGEFRAEDALCCAWIAADLVVHGYTPENDVTAALISSSADTPAVSIRVGPSAEFLRSTGRVADIDFVIDHVDDTECILRRDGSRVCFEHEGEFSLGRQSR